MEGYLSKKSELFQSEEPKILLVEDKDHVKLDFVNMINNLTISPDGEFFGIYTDRSHKEYGSVNFLSFDKKGNLSKDIYYA